MATLSYKELIAESKTRSAQIPTGKLAFSWLVAVIIFLLESKAAEPTKKLEYGA